MKNILALLLIVLIFFGCSQNSGNQPIAGDGDTENDTVHMEVEASFNGEKKKIRIRKDLGFEKDIQTFLDEYSGKKMVVDTSFKLDVTGDQSPDEVLFSIKPYNNTYIINNRIRTNDTIVWSDSLVVNDEYGNFIWGEDSSYFLLKPYSTFFMALGLKNFIENFVFEPESSTMFIQYALEDKEDSTIWKQDLQEYKGKIIHDLSFEDYSSYVWDKRKRKFVLYYAP